MSDPEAGKGWENWFTEEEAGAVEEEREGEEVLE